MLMQLSVSLAHKDVKDFFVIIYNMENLEQLSLSMLTSGEVIVDLESMASPSQ